MYRSRKEKISHWKQKETFHFPPSYLFSNIWKLYDKRFSTRFLYWFSFLLLYLDTIFYISSTWKERLTRKIFYTMVSVDLELWNNILVSYWMWFFIKKIFILHTQKTKCGSLSTQQCQTAGADPRDGPRGLVPSVHYG